MAARLETELQRKGMGMIAPQQGLAVLEQLLLKDLSIAAQPVQVGVVPINWSTFKDKRPFLTDLQPIRLSARPGILQELRTIPVDKRRSRILAHVRSEVAQVLGHESAAISQSEGLFEMGMDSLTSVELRNRLQNSLECSLPSTFAFDYPTVGALVDYLASNMLKVGGAIPKAHSASPASELSQTPKDIRKLLQEKLAKIEGRVN